MQENKWIRLRTNGIKTTLTYKDAESNTIDGTKEVEIEVEGEAEEEVIRIRKILGIDDCKVTILNCGDIYKQIYNIDISKIKELKF